MDTVRNKINKVIENNTGHTFNPLPGRYIVSLPGEKVFDTAKDGAVERATVAVLEDMERTGENMSVGLWMDRGLLYVDVSESYDSLEDAMRVGRERDQLAIYDQVADKVIVVNAE